MKNNKLRLFVAFIAMSLAIQACSFSFSTANFDDAFMSKDAEGSQRTTTYGQGDIFYAIVDLANAPDDTVVRAEWFAVNAEGVAANTQLDDVSSTSGAARLTFNLANAVNMLWPAGQYRVDLYLNDELKTSLGFQVAALPAAPTATPAPTPEPTPTAEPISGLSTFEGDGFTLALPDSFAASGATTIVMDTPVYASDGFTNMSVSSFPDSSDQTLDQLVESIIAQYGTLPGYTYLAQTRMEHPSYEMAGLAVSAEQEGMTELIIVVQYIVKENGVVWTLTYGTTESSFPNWQNLFDESALTFQIAN
ncbi:MAG: hypothetical protein M1347_03375 [Chloroflexi bacterium]|nr:hypothetical protein [Chloroflexota bacterium]